MNIKQAIENYLLTKSGLTALIGSNLFWREFPQGFTGKGLLINKVSGPRETGGVDPGIVYGRFQFTAMGTTEKEPDDILNQVRAALQNFTGYMGAAGEDPGVKIDYTEYANEMELPTDARLTGIYLNAADWLIYYHE
jgi:hypothetical protein